MSDWDDLIRDLTREHQAKVRTDDGDVYTKVDSLLQQLRDELFGSNDKGAIGGNKTKLPLNAPALDLYQLIDRQVAEVWAAVFNRIPSTERTEALLTRWAAYVRPESIIRYSSPETVRPNTPDQHVIWILNESTAENLLRRWKRQIDELFNPPRTAEIKAACIQCGERVVYRQVDGQNIPQPALSFIRDRETGETVEARCGACNTSWLPSQFRYLAEKIGENEKMKNTVALAANYTDVIQ